MRSQLFQNFSELAAIELPTRDIFSAKEIAGRIAQGEPLLLLSCTGLKQLLFLKRCPCASTSPNTYYVK